MASSSAASQRCVVELSGEQHLGERTALERLPPGVVATNSSSPSVGASASRAMCPHQTWKTARRRGVGGHGTRPTRSRASSAPLPIGSVARARPLEQQRHVLASGERDHVGLQSSHRCARRGRHARRAPRRSAAPGTACGSRARSGAGRSRRASGGSPSRGSLATGRHPTATRATAPSPSTRARPSSRPRARCRRRRRAPDTGPCTRTRSCRRHRRRRRSGPGRRGRRARPP